MEKAKVDRDRNVWIIPREKTKAKRSLVLPLSLWAQSAARRSGVRGQGYPEDGRLRHDGD
jgi:hypothetical protein